MKEFLQFVVEQLTDQPDDVALREEIESDLHSFVLTLPSSEVGKVIGKQGHTIRAIRNLLGAAAARNGQRVSFEIEE